MSVETDCRAVWVAPKAAEQDWVLVVKGATQLDLGACHTTVHLRMPAVMRTVGLRCRARRFKRPRTQRLQQRGQELGAAEAVLPQRGIAGDCAQAHKLAQRALQLPLQLLPVGGAPRRVAGAQALARPCAAPCAAPCSARRAWCVSMQQSAMLTLARRCVVPGWSSAGEWAA